MLGIFAALDLFSTTASGSLSLVPMTLLIATFGRTENRRRAAIKFFLYAFIPSAILLVAILWLYNLTGTFDLPTLQALAAAHHLAANAHRAAPLLDSLPRSLRRQSPRLPAPRLATGRRRRSPHRRRHGARRQARPLLHPALQLRHLPRPVPPRSPRPHRPSEPSASSTASLIALIKTDLKKLAAFSTLSHVSFVVLGIFTFTVMGLDGGIFQILNESLIGAAFFILLGLLYERYGTYDMRDYGGLATRHPWMVTMFVITILAAGGLPMLNGFVGEFLILSGSMQSIAAHHILWTVLAATGVIFGASYMLWMIQRVFYGTLGVRPEEVSGWDLTAREHLELWPFAALFLIMGVASPLWMNAIDTYGTPHRRPETLLPRCLRKVSSQHDPTRTDRH